MNNRIKFIAFALLATTVFTSCEKDVTYYTVTFEANGGTLSSEAKIIVAEGETVPYPNAMPPESYAPNGWYCDAELIGKWNFNDAVTTDMTLYAGWKRLYTITYHANGGTFANSQDGGETATMDFAEGDRLSVPQSVIRDGYVLEGWYRDAALTEQWDFLADVVTADEDIYAKWGEGIEGFTLENYPMVDGATSTRALNHMIACKLLGLPYIWQGMSETMEGDVWPMVDKNGWRSSDPTYFDECIQTSQTHGAMMNLIDGKADIILRSTTASPDERATAQAAGVTLIETPIALDAFVFLKNRANTVQSLTLEQIRKIMTKQITNWAQVGGKNVPITVYARPRNSGSEEALRELVMKDLEPAEFPEEHIVGSMVGVFWELDRDPQGFSYIFKNYKEMILRRPEPVFAIDGIAPNAATIKDRSYPLTTEVYAIIRSDLDRGSNAYKLYEWLGTNAAKLVLEECGFIPY